MKPAVHYSPEVFERLLEELAKGRSLRAVCQDPGMPSQPAVNLWIAHDPALADAYYAARRAGSLVWLDDVIEMSDDSRGKDMAGVQSHRLSVDSRKWALGKLHPERFGDHLTVEHHSYRTLHLAADHPDALDGHETTVIEGQGARIFLPDNSREVGPEIDGQDPAAA